MLKMKIQKPDEKTLFYLCLADIMFFPYLKPFSFPFSYLIVMLWYVCGGYKKIQKLKDCSCVILFCFPAALATVISPLFAEKTVFSTDVKRFLQYVMCFLCLLFFENILKRYEINLRKIFVIFLLVMALYAVFYLVNPHLYAHIKSIIYPADNHTKRYLMNQVAYRFNYLLADPNNAGYLSDGIFAFLIFHEKIKPLEFVSLFFLLALILFTTQSIGAIVVFAMVMVCYLLYLLIKLTQNKYNVTVPAIAALVILLASAACFVPVMLNSATFHAFTDRTMVYRGMKDSSGGRMSDFINGLRHFDAPFLLIGIGEERVVSEIGHWYLIYMYGGIAYLLFMYVTFRKNMKTTWWEYVSLFPFFMAFSMNIAIGEQKFLLLMFLVVAVLRSESEKRRRQAAYRYDTERITNATCKGGGK